MCNSTRQKFRLGTMGADFWLGRGPWPP